MKYILVIALLFIAATAEAQMTCTPVTTTTQNCAATVTVTLGTPTGNQLQATAIQIRRSDGTGAKQAIGTMPMSNLVLQNSFTDAGGIKHCYDAVATSGGFPATSPEQCWTTPLIAAAGTATPTLNLSSISSTALRATWDDVQNETGYELWGKMAKETSEQYALLVSLPADTVTWDWTLRKHYTSYCMKVRAAAGAFGQPGCATTSK